MPRKKPTKSKDRPISRKTILKDFKKCLKFIEIKKIIAEFY